MTLYELVANNEGFDIGDNIFDYGNYFDFEADSDDYYDLCLGAMAKEIEAEQVKPHWYTICKITDFLEKRKDLFTEFMNTFYDEKYHITEEIKSDNEEFYDTYITCFNIFINGGFSDRLYKWMYERLSEVQKNGQKIQYWG